MNTVPDKVKIVGLCGSLREDSYTRKTLRNALDGAAKLADSVSLIDLREYELPFCDGSTGKYGPDSDVKKLRNKVKSAQGIILGTPEYHGSFTGVLKNALDLMGFEEFEGKMLGLVSVSAGQMGGINALDSLRTIGRSLHAWVIPGQVAIPRVHEAFDETGNFRNHRLEERVKEVGREVARFAYLHTADQPTKFVRVWEEAPENPGARDR